MKGLTPQEMDRIKQIADGLNRMRDCGADVSVYEAVFFLKIIDRLVPGKLPKGWNSNRRAESDCYDPHCPHHGLNRKLVPAVHQNPDTFCTGTPCFCGDRR